MRYDIAEVVDPQVHLVAAAKLLKSIFAQVPNALRTERLKTAHCEECSATIRAPATLLSRPGAKIRVLQPLAQM
jgi:hypothetical protein